MGNTKNISLLVVKPESLDRLDELAVDLKKRNYELIARKIFDEWINHAKKIYGPDGTSEDTVETWRKGYQLKKLGDTFCVLALRNTYGDTLECLAKDVGNWRHPEEGSLRKKYGLPESENLVLNGELVLFNGLHKPRTEKDLNDHLEIFDMADYLDNS